MDYPAAKAHILNRLKKELNRKLFYHGVHHTLDVLQVTKELCIIDNLSSRDTTLLKTAALFHDSGFIISRNNHEELGCQIASQCLARFNYSKQDIDLIGGMIMATRIPQSPQSHLEEILCDADLDYLGRDDFYSIGRTLYEELKAYKVLSDEKSWNRIQVSFLENHHFHTNTTFERRNKRKQMYLEQLKELVAGYEEKK